MLILSVTHYFQHHMMRPFIPLYASSLGVDYAGIGVIAASVAVLPIFLAMPAGVFVDRVGVRVSVMIGAALSATSYFLLWGFGSSFGVIVVTQMISGVALLLMVVGAQSYVGSLGRGGTSARNFSYYTVVASVGQIIGPLAGGLIVEAAGFGAGFLLAAGLGLTSLLIAFFLLPRHTAAPLRPATTEMPRRSNRKQALHYLADPRMRSAILISALMAIPEVLRTSFLPIYLDEVVGLGLREVGFTLSVFAIAGLAARLLMPTLARLLGSYLLMVIVGVVAATSLAFVPTTTSIAVILGLVASLGTAFGMGRPLSMSLVADSAENDRMGLAVGLRLTGNRVADFVAPLVFGLTATAFTIGSVFSLGAVLVGLGTVAVVRHAAGDVRSLWRQRRKDENGEGDTDREAPS